MAINLAVHKRTTNEVVRLLEKKPGIEINFIPNNSEGFDCTIKTNNVKIEFVLNTFYPFHPPKSIRVEKEPYPLLLTKENCEIGKQIYPSGCMCCSSVLCKWAPTNKIEDLLKEIIKNIGIINSYYHNHCYSLRSANGGWEGRGEGKPSLPIEICRVIENFLVIQTDSNKF